MLILQNNMERLAAQAHNIQGDQQEAMKQKDETIKRLHTEVETIRAGWNKYITHVSSEMVLKETKIITLQERETKLRTELERSREEIKRYKRQLSAGWKREKALEQMRVQVELEWQRRCEDMKAEHYLAHEQLIQDLTQARDQAEAELKEKEQELQALTVNMKRDQTIQGPTTKMESVASEELRRLQEQNSSLRAMVTQMRKDMEDLSQLLPHTQAQPWDSSLQPVHQGAPDQVATGPPAQSTEISSDVSPAGGVCLEKNANTSALTKKVTVEHIPKQNVPLQEEDPYLQQQQASSLMSGVCLEKVRLAKSNPPLLRSRLKRAAFCIARLSREKQQLIEMVNRLHGQNTTAGLTGCFTERDSSAEKLSDQGNQLSALEPLQYQLATQSSKNDEDTPSPSKLQMFLDVGPKHCSDLSRSHLSSDESFPSLKELWERLDNGLSPSIFSEGEGEASRSEVDESGGAGSQMMVHGISATIQSQPPTQVQQRRNPSTAPSNTTKTSRAKAPDKTSKIRNYNNKD
ncbi:coiled-coil domain-containing protein 57 [Acanthopagrus latus]|uniref:coiled-coil domain-containing protein 57 n=1 Tax=Acanthopagrus latus TaxID=8177 RepID=UPI00187CE026|nr:coiled-coil domain-containing protein 57 [Acanthopagrus latus]XP_036936639.1 coiled-coil domain-containing protein 57 [Acanthopagrus latus]XP_036936640.1 coiled-coil domain-containing protein 57 [Acanthopagrus latus]XP_036936641.1 coiled-coil domain-containing protein 57 [Acanthopagrus latus]